MKISELRPNKLNPRKISDKKRSMLAVSLEKFGDLSGFVYNVRSKSLVSGHQKQRVIPPDSKIVIEVTHPAPTTAGTVAEGYVLINGERFKYRAVDWDAKTEAEAMIAANKHGGEFDAEVLRVLFANNPGLNAEHAGFEKIELEEYKIKIDEVKIDAPAIQGSSFDADEGEDSSPDPEQESDERYVRNNPGADEMTEKEKIDMINRTKGAFDKVDEKRMDHTGRRFVIIIDCKDQEAKDALKEKLREIVESSGAKFF